jgi:hypothetical protein
MLFSKVLSWFCSSMMLWVQDNRLLGCATGVQLVRHTCPKYLLMLESGCDGFLYIAFKDLQLLFRWCVLCRHQQQWTVAALQSGRRDVLQACVCACVCVCVSTHLWLLS